MSAPTSLASLVALDINERVRQLIADPLLRVIEQMDLFGDRSTRYAYDARLRVSRHVRNRQPRPQRSALQQFTLLFKEAARPKRGYRRRADRFGSDHPTWSAGEACALPVWVLLESIQKLTRMEPGSEAAEEVWGWIEEIDPPMVKRFDARGRAVPVPYPFAFENACRIGGMDPEFLRERLRPYRRQPFPNSALRDPGTLFREHLDRVADLAELSQ